MTLSLLGAAWDQEWAGARLSPDGTYRYELHRVWGSGPLALWIMLNPSTADAEVDDPTIRRCRGFTSGWGLGGLVVVNLYALRSPDPRALRAHPEPQGDPENWATIARWLAWDGIAVAVAAWGAHAQRDREAEVSLLAADQGRTLECLGTTKDGHPRHPLYVRGDAPREAWSGTNSAQAHVQRRPATSSE